MFSLSLKRFIVHIIVGIIVSFGLSARIETKRRSSQMNLQMTNFV